MEKSIFLPTAKSTTAGVDALEGTSSVASDLSISHCSGQTWTKFWVVAEPFELENGGFSRTVDGHKYLTCAECEREVIGKQELPAQEVYICCEKVNYTS